MSGGHFDYNQFKLLDIVSEIDEIIKNNNVGDEYGFIYNYSHETIEKMKLTSMLLKRCHIMVHRIDWLHSGDDGEDTFNQKWNEEELNNIKI